MDAGSSSGINERFLFRGRDLTPILANPASEVQDYVHFTYEDDQFPLRGAANCIRAIVEKEWKYAVYYDPFQGAPVEYEMYNLKDDPYESTNLAHPEHYQPAYAEERRRLHNRLLEVMQTHGTTPPEVQFPTAEALSRGMKHRKRSTTIRFTPASSDASNSTGSFLP
jgi:choline-sulfatase